MKIANKIRNNQYSHLTLTLVQASTCGIFAISLSLWIALSAWLVLDFLAEHIYWTIVITLFDDLLAEAAIVNFLLSKPPVLT